MPRTYTPSKSSRLLSSSRACRMLQRAHIVKKKPKRVPKVKLEAPKSNVTAKETKSDNVESQGTLDGKPSTGQDTSLVTEKKEEQKTQSDHVGPRQRTVRMSMPMRLQAIHRRYEMNALNATNRSVGEGEVQQIYMTDNQYALVKWERKDSLTWEPYSEIPIFVRRLYEQQGVITLGEYCYYKDAEQAGHLK